MGIGFVVVFPLTFISQRVRADRVDAERRCSGSPRVNPVSVLVAAVRALFGNPVAPVTKHIWPIDHPVAAAWLYCVALVAARLVIAQRRYRARTTD